MMFLHPRLVLAAVVCVFCLGWPGAARAQFATPDSLLRALYALYGPEGTGPGFPDDPTGIKQFLEPALARALIRVKAGKSEVMDFLDYDPFVQGQDWDISALVIGPSTITDGKATVRVKFRNFNEPKRLLYRLVRGTDGWRIYDVATVDGGRGLRRELGLRE